MEEKTVQAFNWRSAIDETYWEFSRNIIDYVPQLIGALALLITGWIVAHLFRLGTRKILGGVNALFTRTAKNEGVKQVYIDKSYALIISQVVFWAIFIFFLAACANLLGWNMFSEWMNSLVGFLPNLITGLLIIMAGFMISGAARGAIMTAAHSAGIAQSSVLARVAQVVILFSLFIIGVEQIGLNVHFLTSIIVVTTGILLAGAALAFSLGAGTMVANIIGAQHTRKHCRIGEYMKIADYEGEILEVTQTAIVLDSYNGKVIVPAKLFHEQIILLTPEDDTVVSVPNAEPEIPGGKNV